MSLPENKSKTPFFGGLNNVKFRKQVVPGDILRLVVTIEKLKKSFGKGKGLAYVGEDLVCEAELTFMLG